jgi:Raf kinase inhibitor-like protein, YbhB/YbcL family
MRLLLLSACVVLGACQGSTVPTNAPTFVSTVPAATTILVTATPAPMESTMPTTESTPAGPFALTSGAFAEDGSIPRMYTCDGQDTSPALAWTGAPEGTRTLALIMDDPDAGGFVHWVVFNIASPASSGLTAGLSASASTPSQGRNSFGRVGYGGPCPPSGTHQYVFRLLALDANLSLTGTPRASQVLDAAKGHVLSEARLTATYHRGG